MAHQKHRGFAIVEILLLVVIVGIIAFVAWRVIVANGDVQTVQNQVPQSTATTTTGTNVIAPQNASDLGTLQQQLNSTSVDDNTATDLDTQTTF